MPIWSEILAELDAMAQPGQSIDFDGVRRKYLVALHTHSQRNVILYASDWLQAAARKDSVINDEDLQGLMEVCSKLKGDGLDLILHSPGGSVEAAEAIVSYLRLPLSPRHKGNRAPTGHVSGYHDRLCRRQNCDGGTFISRAD